MIQSRCGFTLIEVLIAILVLGLALGGLYFGATESLKTITRARQGILEDMLVEEIYEEIMALPRGIEPGGATTRAEFVSPLEYDGLVESPPEDPTGDAIPSTGGLTRRVAVQLDAPLLAKITVTLERAGTSVRTLTFHRALR